MSSSCFNVRNHKKNEGQATGKQSEREALFTAEMKILLDVAHTDALRLMKFEDTQRELGRRGSMGAAERTEALSLVRK